MQEVELHRPLAHGAPPFYLKGVKLVSNSFVPGTGVVKVDLIFKLNGQQIMNGLHFVWEAPVGASEFITFAGELVQWYTTYMKPNVPAGLVLENIRVTDMGSENGIQIQYTTGLPLAGSFVTSTMPGNVTAAVKFTTDKRGKSYTGRIFWPALASSTVSDGIIAEGTSIVMKEAFEALIDYAFTGGPVWVVASKIAGGVLRSALETTAIRNVSVDRQVDSQKRRLAGRGR